MKWYEIFRSGEQTDNNGETRAWTNGDLDTMVTLYNEQEPDEKHTAPIILGHVESNTPAFGWVDKLKRVGNTLMATFKDVEPQFQELVNAGRYKTVSAAFYEDLKLRHLAFLGANVPAVKGLEPIQFSQEGNNYSEYTNCFVFQQKGIASMDEFQKALLEFAKITFSADVVAQIEEYINTYNEKTPPKAPEAPAEAKAETPTAPETPKPEFAEMDKLRKKVFELETKQREYEFSELMAKHKVPDNLKEDIRGLLGNSFEFSEENNAKLEAFLKKLPTLELTHEFAERGNAQTGNVFDEIKQQIKYLEDRK